MTGDNSVIRDSATWQKGAKPRVLGDYELVRELGSGGFGVVYEAVHRERRTRVALKALRRPLTASLLDFKKEFRGLAEITHRNLLLLGELVTNVDPPFFTMELIEGLNFIRYVRAGYDSAATDSMAFCDPARLRDALLQTAEGLNALHRAGKLHRDIKPNNVLVEEDGRVVLVDFGLAVEVDQDVFRNTARELAGTPHYMSPEQGDGQPISFGSDWYSVGVMLFEALVGNYPFHAPSFEELQKKKLSSQPPAPKDFAPNVPADLNELCVALLQPDPGARISGEEVIRQLQGHVAPVPRRSAWIGREVPLRKLEEALADVGRGKSRTIFVHGRSGMGKTALVDKFLSSFASRRQWVVLRGRCYENESVPYKGIDAVVDSLCGYLRRQRTSKAERLLPLDVASLCRIFPQLREVPVVKASEREWDSYSDVQESRRRGFAALREMLCRLANFEQLVIFIDDLQWGDHDTSELFQEITQPPGAPRCLIIGAFRSEAAATNPCLVAIRACGQRQVQDQHSPRPEEIEIGPLSMTEATALARELLGTESPNVELQARSIAGESRGDPLFVKILAQYAGPLVDAERGQRDARRVSLEGILWEQISNLSRPQRTAVELVSVAGRPVSPTIVQKAAGLQQDVLLLFRELRLRRLVRSFGADEQESVEAYHDRIRETVVSRLKPQQIAEYAGRLADAHAHSAADADLEFMATLLSRAERHTEAGKYFAKAARQAQDELAFGRAVNLYREAIGALDPQGDEERELRTGLADALAYAGRGAEAAVEYLLAAKQAGRDWQLDLRCQAALRYLTSGHVDEGLTTIDDVLTSVGMPLPSTPARALLSLGWNRLKLKLRGLKFAPHSVDSIDAKQRQLLDVSWSAAAGLSVVDPIRASDFVSRHLLLSLRAGEPKYLIRALAAQVGHVAISGRRSRKSVSRMLQTIRQTADIEDNPYSRAVRELARGTAAHLHGRWKAAQKSCDRAINYLLDRRCQDVAWELDTARTFALWALLYMGDIPEMSRRQPELMRKAQENNDLFAMLNFGSMVMTYVHLGADRPDEVRRRLAEERQLLSKRGFFVQHHNWLKASAYVELYAGNPAAAWEVIADGCRSYANSALAWIEQVRVDFLQVQGRAAIALAAAENGGVGLAAARKIVRKLRREKTAWAAAMAHLIDAGLATVEGNRQQAVQRYERAVAALDAVDMLLFASAARIRLGQLMDDGRGEAITIAGTAKLNQLGIQNTTRMIATLAPGRFL